MTPSLQAQESRTGEKNWGSNYCTSHQGTPQTNDLIEFNQQDGRWGYKEEAGQIKDEVGQRTPEGSMGI